MHSSGQGETRKIPTNYNECSEGSPNKQKAGACDKKGDTEKGWFVQPEGGYRII